MGLASFSDLTLAFHKHLHEHVGSTYYCHYEKLSVGETFTEKLWIQPIWGEVPRYLCANIVTVVLKCQSVIAEDPLLINLRQMADYCVEVYKKNFDDSGDTSNIIPIFQWSNNTPLPTGVQLETFVDRLYELPVNPYDTVAAINVYINLLVCCT
jgi:hypothetical protein